ncbi:MAG: 50S ribosomal protein L21 [Actinobacteria bacterium]|nr:MAG: 50S ribosomal protein L21 [Actinomycetota bacterium]
MYAVVATGGKQLKVAAGDVVSVEKLDAAPGETVKFDVIFLADEGEITIDTDKLAAASVTAEVLEHFKGEKAVVFKFKKRKGYKRTRGHRQDLTRVRITDVAAGAAKKAAPKKKAAEKVEEPVAEATEVPASESE